MAVSREVYETFIKAESSCEQQYQLAIKTLTSRKVEEHTDEYQSPYGAKYPRSVLYSSSKIDKNPSTFNKIKGFFNKSVARQKVSDLNQERALINKENIINSKKAAYCENVSANKQLSKPIQITNEISKHENDATFKPYRLTSVHDKIFKVNVIHICAVTCIPYE